MIDDAIKYEDEEDYYEIQFGCIDGNNLKTSGCEMYGLT
jgi:hypothetical protein